MQRAGAQCAQRQTLAGGAGVLIWGPLVVISACRRGKGINGFAILSICLPLSTQLILSLSRVESREREYQRLR